ncbi:transposable element Tcb2 transposase [Trichonephila clavipes]|nr:transposable element Tcb2 transposase [Trichonephila clavipes]
MPSTNKSLKRPPHRKKCTVTANCFISHHPGKGSTFTKGALCLLEPYEGGLTEGHFDESKFNLSNDNNRVRVWRPFGKHLNPAFAFQRHTTPTLDVMPLMQWLLGAIVQQDDARPYTARISQDYIHTATLLPCPARSPDLSAIKHIWDHLG